MNKKRLDKFNLMTQFTQKQIKYKKFKEKQYFKDSNP